MLFFLPNISLRQRRQTTVVSRAQNKKPRANEQIRVPEVMLVTDGVTEVLPTEVAIARAREQELDLIEVSPKANPPVVKIADIGQFMYQLQKKERKQRAHSKQTEVKTLRFGFRTERHDLDRLVNRAKEFLEEKHLVKFVVRLRGRELTNKGYAETKLRLLVEQMKDDAEVEQTIKKQGNQFIVILRAKR